MAKTQQIKGIKTIAEMAQVAASLATEGVDFVVTKNNANEWEFDLITE